MLYSKIFKILSAMIAKTDAAQNAVVSTVFSQEWIYYLPCIYVLIRIFIMSV